MTSLQAELARIIPIERFQNPPPVVAVVRLSGVISATLPTWRRGGLNLHSLAGPLEKAFKLNNLKAVALAVNSPGGSPVQSSLIYKRIRSLAKKRKLPVVAFAEDVAASGGYWLACAADEIFVDESSIIGSIGVIHAGFGFQELIARYGIERRIHTSGSKKSTLDPFRAEDRDDVLHLRATQAEVHDAFIQVVRDRRGGRLRGPAEDLFSGEYWTGRRALQHGLVDGIGDVRTIMEERFGERVRLVNIGDRSTWLRRRLGLPAVMPDDWARSALSVLEERAQWARFGL